MKLRVLLVLLCLAISLIPVAMIVGLQDTKIATAFLALMAAVTFSVAFLMSYFIARPITSLTRRIDQISKGNLDVQLEGSEIDEINTLTASLDRVMASLKLAIHKVGVRKEDIFEQTVKAKEEAESRYEHLVQILDGWIWEVARDGRVTYCLGNVGAVLGYEPAALIGRDVAMVFPSEEAASIRRRIAQVIAANQSAPFATDWVMARSDGTAVRVHTQVVPLTAEGKVTALYCFSRPVVGSGPGPSRTPRRSCGRQVAHEPHPLPQRTPLAFHKSGRF